MLCGMTWRDMILACWLQPVDGTANAVGSAIYDVSVDHRHSNFPMPQKFLNRTDVVTRFEQMPREAMPHGMRHSGLLHHRLMYVVPALHPSLAIRGMQNVSRINGVCRVGQG